MFYTLNEIKGTLLLAAKCLRMTGTLRYDWVAKRTRNTLKLTETQVEEICKLFIDFDEQKGFTFNQDSDRIDPKYQVFD